MSGSVPMGIGKANDLTRLEGFEDTGNGLTRFDR